MKGPYKYRKYRNGCDTMYEVTGPGFPYPEYWTQRASAAGVCRVANLAYAAGRASASKKGARRHDSK